MNPELPKSLTTPTGRVFVLVAALAIVALQLVLQALPFPNRIPADSFGVTVNYYFGYFLLLVAGSAGPVWVVLEDRATDHPRAAMIRGVCLAGVIGGTPDAVARFGAFGSRSGDLDFAAFSIFLVLLLASMAWAFVALPAGSGERARPRLPQWLTGSGGRFLFLVLWACLESVLMWIVMMGPESGGSAVAPSAAIMLLIGLPISLAHIAVGPIWSALDDRRTEQPWFAILRGICLDQFISNVATCASVLSFYRGLPEGAPGSAAQLLGVDPFTLFLTALAALVFIALPAPRTKAATT